MVSAKIVLASLPILMGLVAHSDAGVVLASPAEFSGNETIIGFDLDLTNGDRLSPDTINGVTFSVSIGLPPLFQQSLAARQFGPSGKGSIVRSAFDFDTNTQSAADLIFQFSGPVDRIGMEILAQFDSDIVVEFLRSGILIETTIFTFAPSPKERLLKNGIFQFFGFQSNSPFDEVRLVQGEIPGSGGFSGFTVDNVRFESISGAPEPGSFAILACGLAGIALRARGGRLFRGRH